MADAADRIDALDLVRGVAVLGILTVNIAGFAGTTTGTLSPNLPEPGTTADLIAFTGIFLLFEGKMRALFTILFGASLMLFVERADAAGRDGDHLQLRRLGWLLLIGYLHFALLWWGDILFLYALAGIPALMMRRWSPRALLLGALILYAGWHVHGAMASQPDVLAERHVLAGSASPAELAGYQKRIAGMQAQSAAELAEYRSGFLEQARAKLVGRPLWPVQIAIVSLGETLPLIMLGMALLRLGVFSGDWPVGRLRAIAAGGLLGGGALTGGFCLHLAPMGYPYEAMLAAFQFWLALPHLLMAMGYLALLLLLAPRLLRTAGGSRLRDAGRVALSNYIGTTLFMTAIFYGWGLGLVGQLGHAAQMPFILLGWILMLAWPTPWLRTFRQGPLEWAWRSLTERRLLPIRR